MLLMKVNKFRIKKYIAQVIEQHWYKKTNSMLTVCFLPLSGVFACLSFLKKKRALRDQIERYFISSAAICVVGNIGVGGNGKTPIALYLIEHLTSIGYKVGVVLRGGRACDKPTQVTRKSSVSAVGDEAMLYANSSAAIVVACHKRVDAVYALNQLKKVDIIISDDGLQHYHMPRDYEIVVIDGSTRPTSYNLLPNGPFRERLDRLKQVNQIIITNPNPSVVSAKSSVDTKECFDNKKLKNTKLNKGVNYYDYAQPVALAHWHFKGMFSVLQKELKKGQTVTEAEPLSESMCLNAWQKLLDSNALKDQFGDKQVIPIVIVSAIAKPQRVERLFNKVFTHYIEQGLIKVVDTLYFEDHHLFTSSDFNHLKESIVVMTSKDMVKCHTFAQPSWFYMDLSVVFSEGEGKLWENLTLSCLPIAPIKLAPRK